ncbi:sugar phosphate isomerase/epimerase family protein [Actinophytocola sp.]|uniref:sugar phosphate isomerase/epimerase family protein n=1 Tax=Actinophytocola sp. TaxID=1872138 RepID=UPI003D6B50AA
MAPGADHGPATPRRLTASSLTFGQTPFEERVRVAASAGFDGIGLSAEVYAEALRNGLDDSDMLAMLDEHELVVTEVEFLSDWFLDDAPASPSSKETTLLHLARVFGAERINVGLFEKHPLDEMCRSFAALCERAGDVKIALEFMPFGGIPSLPTAWELVRSVDRDNAGLLLDVWHWVRADTTTEDFARVPADRVFAVQLCDVGRDRLEEMRFESLHRRLVPGDGDGHATSLLSLLVSHGVDADICVEVMSDELAASGTMATATSVFAGATEVLSKVTAYTGR